MDTAQWPQEIGLGKPSMEEMLPSSTNTCSTRPQMVERRVRPQKEQALNCPRCNSTNTKFCYYNNYSLTQPRYFCKTCRRYWTEGGSLRNVPVGGGSRKNKRSSNSSATITSSSNPSSVTTSASSRKLPHVLTPPPIISSSNNQSSKFHDQGQDLNLAFPQHHMAGEYGEFPGLDNNNNNNNPSTCSSAAGNHNALSAMDFLRGGISSRWLSPFMPMAMPETGEVYPSGFGLQDFRSTTINFPMDGLGAGGGYGNVQAGIQEGGSGRMLFPFEDLRQASTNPTEFDPNRGQGGDSSGFWNGVIGNGGSWTNSKQHTWSSF